MLATALWSCGASLSEQAQQVALQQPSVPVSDAAIALAATGRAAPHSIDALQRRNALRKELSCADDDSFLDSQGVSCEGWASLDCLVDDGLGSVTQGMLNCGYEDPTEIVSVRNACPLSCNMCNAIVAGGDPVLKYNGRFIKFSLQPNTLSPLLIWTAKNGDELSILGSTLGHPTQADQQWFNHLLLTVNGTRTLGVSIKQPSAQMEVWLDGDKVDFPRMCSWKSFKVGKCVEGEKSDKQSFLREFISKHGHLSFTWSDMKHRLIGRRRAKKALAPHGVPTPNPIPIPHPRWLNDLYIFNPLR